jgi:myo-inositol-1(or 4)-monophosphatase
MIDFIEEIARGAGEMLLTFFKKGIEVRKKGDQAQVVTDADEMSEKFIIEKIKEKFPAHMILAEESGLIGDKSEDVWIIDPLDGTSNFAANIPLWGVMIAHLRSGEVLESACFVPFFNDMYTAQKGKGAFLNGETISVSGEENLENMLGFYSLDATADQEKLKHELSIIEDIVQNMRNLRATGTLLDMLYVADGRAGIVANQVQKVWDLAAPFLILQEAGAKVTDINGKGIQFILEGEDMFKTYSVLAASPILHDHFLKSIT